MNDPTSQTPEETSFWERIEKEIDERLAYVAELRKQAAEVDQPIIIESGENLS